jgi:hypothetical protein
MLRIWMEAHSGFDFRKIINFVVHVYRLKV